MNAIHDNYEIGKVNLLGFNKFIYERKGFLKAIKLKKAGAVVDCRVYNK